MCVLRSVPGFLPAIFSNFNRIFDQLRLKKQSSLDVATDESMQDFIKNLVNTKEDTLNKARTTWLQVRRCEIVTTPAHEALLKIVNLLTENKKSIFVYTGNIWNLS